MQAQHDHASAVRHSAGRSQVLLPFDSDPALAHEALQHGELGHQPSNVVPAGHGHHLPLLVGELWPEALQIGERTLVGFAIDRGAAGERHAGADVRDHVSGQPEQDGEQQAVGEPFQPVGHARAARVGLAQVPLEIPRRGAVLGGHGPAPMARGVTVIRIPTRGRRVRRLWGSTAAPGAMAKVNF